MAFFRVFFADGTSGVLAASSPSDARKQGEKQGPVVKVKLDRDRLGATDRRPRITRKSHDTKGAPPCR
ncbi:hypothetical protein [Aureimonas sp. AU40]|uniref:hypothetical protein n=1 Tax=Aureimonas sp. AU40 TaxID=1637747 RepID=UPI0007857025|nr:hypothetical protein [Aureimonas sp. AU40]